ncbi:MAG: T9SS type A sorting domain-containing protein, partial [Bacteroidales bacterium]|nr:T9SS type A sorting domain-containing protein [Bacteroidales bacterium]
ITYTDGTNTFNETTSDNPFVFAVSESGTYEITALSDVNCTGSDFSGEAVVIVNELPNVDLGDDVYITTDESVILDAGEGFVSYLWSNESIEQTLTLNGSDLGVGSFEYNVLVEDINTCENSDTVVVNVEAGSLVESLTYSKIIIYPNPTKGIVKFDMNNSNSVTDIKITDEFGRLIKHIKINDDPYLKIDLSEQAKGFYFIHIQSETGIIIKKIVLQ